MIFTTNVQAKLIELATEEFGDDCDYAAILNRTPVGTVIIGCDDDETDESDMSDIERIALMMDYYYGNFDPQLG